MSEEIPGPPGLPFVGNVFDIDPNNTINSFSHLADKYGPIFKLSVGGQWRYFVAGFEPFSELTDDKRFRKGIAPALKQVRNGAGSGLFTAFHGEHDWEIAHRTLLPAFGPLPIQNMFDEMYDIASQLILKWARNGPGTPISVTDDFTRLTLDSIAICALDTRFNSFARTEQHPFVKAMVDFLVESGNRQNRPAVAQMFYREANKKYNDDINLMHSVAQEVLDRRRKNPSDKKDLLNAMVIGKDPKTGEQLSDENIMNNMITFLIAGHETTAGMLSFTTYYLLKNPSAYRRAQQEVDSVVGTGPVKYEHTKKLPFIEACLRETLRLEPTAPGFSREPSQGHDETLCGGKYLIPDGSKVFCLLQKIQRDPAVFGEDADEFKPERMLDENFQKLPGSSWKPFGTGPRGCIGRPFAWQEGVLALAMILQNFELRLADPGYQLHIKQTLTVKPADLYMYATPRGDHTGSQLERRLYGGAFSERATDHKVEATSTQKSGTPITILFGSNTGTCEGLAQTLASRAGARGFAPSVATLDSAVDKLPTDRPVIILTASFEGEPADNAAQFVEWIGHADSFKGVKYAVFGCGHHDWVSTFHKIPKYIDKTLQDKSATRLTERGESDVALGGVFDDFDAWIDEKLWPSLGSQDTSVSDELNGLNVEISPPTRISALKHSVSEAVVESTAELSKTGGRDARSATFRLPTGTSYTAGDYLNVLPLNTPQVVKRVLKRFGFAWDTEITIKEGSHTALPVGQTSPVALVLSSYVELGSPASKKNMLAMTHLTEDDATKKALEGLATNSADSKLSVLDILEMHPLIQCPFGLFLSLLPYMRIRQYSISSSPLVDPSLASITYQVLDVPMAGAKDKHFLGVTTNYLKRLEPGQKAQIAIKKSHYSFHLPSDPQRPIVMVCAGTGIAPFHAFVEERAEKIKGGQKLGRALLFIGCRDPEHDLLYADQLAEWEKLGAVEVFYAFSRKPEDSKGSKYAQDRVYSEKDNVFEVFSNNAKVFICGSSRLGTGVKEVSKRLYAEKLKEKGENKSEEEIEEWFKNLKVQERWTSDVFD
ncbi:cytochrome P450 [Rhizodiscina lignyota]|uniref:Bifunctional cytochrome P450/NADPH--P450 reductase n=1 Tax=Rhizodiscina lignyota TaxID=1504668 RepID=A0A9P4MBG5_9PEZI|nr:cytochrome P450 [Rhizodiscina lignyota]